jgi:hypothetical protein
MAASISTATLRGEFMPIRLDIAPTSSTVKDYAQDAVRTMQKVYGIQMDHSLDSLAHVDRVLREWREGGATVEQVTKSLYALGSYAGEVLREPAHGRWFAPPVAPYGELDSLFLYVRLPGNREWRPIALAFYNFLNEPETTLEASARTVLASKAR